MVYLAQFAMYITDIKLNNRHKSTMFEFDRVDIFHGISIPATLYT